MDALAALALAHAAATWFMVGLIWTVQVVHYPLFARVGADGFAGYHAAHAQRISRLLALPWGAESVTALALVVLAPAGPARALAWLGLALLVVAVVATAALAVPEHRALAAGFDPAAHRRLQRRSWLRAAAWSARGLVALALVALLA